MSLAALLAGAALPLALAPFDFWPALLASAGALFLVLERTGTARRAFWRGWLFGVGKYGVGASWVYVSIHVHGHAPPLLAGALVALFVAGLALLAGLQGVFFHVFREMARWPRVVGFTVAWVCVEWLLTWMLSGFPWLFAGYAFLDTPLAGWAPIGGVLLVSAAGVSSGVLIAIASTSRTAGGPGVVRFGLWPWALGTVAAIWLGGWLLQSISWTQRGELRSVALVQGNMPQQTRWTAQGVVDAAERYDALSSALWERDIVVWPEGAIPDMHWRVAPRIEAMRGVAAGRIGDLVYGATTAERGEDDRPLVYNAAISTGGGEYRKRRLVPFGEYVPLEGLLRGTIAFFDLPMSNFAAGEGEPQMLRAAGVPVAVAICYEIAYPFALARRAAEASLLATLSNDAWFGESIGPWQHMQIARMRALENGRFLLRATNNGITAVVDERGRVVASLPQFEASALLAHVYATSGTTPYGAFGALVVTTILAGATAFVVLLPLWRRWALGRKGPSASSATSA